MTEPKGDSAVTRDDAGDCGGRDVDRFVEAPVRSPIPTGDSERKLSRATLS